jgi:hypothetical protein
MPRGPKGEKRPADVIGNTVHVMRIATGEIEDNRHRNTREGVVLTVAERGRRRSVRKNGKR